MSIFWDDISYNQECKVFINISGGFIVMNWKIIGINLYLCSLSYFFSQGINFFFKETFVSFIQKVLANINEKKNKMCLFSRNPVCIWPSYVVL